MPLAEVWLKVWIYLGLVCGWSEGARPRFDTSTDMGLVLIPADAEVDSVIFRLRATDQDADFPLVFEVTATITPVVRIDNLPCTLYNKVCQANVILTKRLMPGRLHDFAVRVRDTKGDSNSMQATISATNATTSRDKIFPHIPSLIMVPEDARPGKELDYLLVRANSWSGKPVYIELWQPKELFTIRQRQTPTQTRGVITLIGELDFETQSMYTLTIYATDPYTEPGKDTRNIAGLNIVVIVQDVQDVPPIFTLAPPLTRLNNSVQTGDIILRVHAEDGDKGVPREITYGLVSEGNPFIPFFNISETNGEIVLAKPLEELTQITHVGAPVVLTVVAEEIRRSRDEPPAQATIVDVGFLLGEPGNSPPYFENDNYIAAIPENLEPGSTITFSEQYSTRIHDEDIGKAGVFALKLQNNNGTFEISPTVAERMANFIIMVRDNTLIDYEMYKALSFKIIAQEVGPATNLSASAAVVIFIQDVNDNSPVFDEKSYEVTLSENITAGTRVIQVRATDEDTGVFGSIQYTDITGQGSEAFAIDPDTGLITVAMGSSLDREMAAQLQLTVNARDEHGKGNTGVVPLIVNLLDVNDNVPTFERDTYEFTLNSDLTNFTTAAVIKATDADAEPPNNEIRYELIQGNYENKFYLNEITGELILRSPITKFRRKKQTVYDNLGRKLHKGFLQPGHTVSEIITTVFPNVANTTENILQKIALDSTAGEMREYRRGKREETDVLYILTARAYDLGVPHLASETHIWVVRGTAMEARIMMFVVPGEHPNLTRTAETLATITGGRVTVLDTRPYTSDNRSGVISSILPSEGKRTIVVARVEQTEPGAPLVDVEKIRTTLAANGVGIIGGTTNVSMNYATTTKFPIGVPYNVITRNEADNSGSNVNTSITRIHEEVTVYRAENKLLFWLLIILGLLMVLAIAVLIICCICPGCPFYMAPRKRRVYSSSETLVARSDGRPKRHLRRKPMAVVDIVSNGKKQAWSADPTRRNWQFNRRNTKNGGLASLPGDVVYISERPMDQSNIDSQRLHEGSVYDPPRRKRMDEQDRMYMEDVEEGKVREYDAMDVESLQRHDIEPNSDILHQAYKQRYIDPESNNEFAVREQHFYREGNAEVLQLVTRGQVEDNGSNQHRHYSTTLIVDGKDVLLQRFMQDQKARHEASMQEPEVLHTVESHQRQKGVYQRQQEIILLPEELEVRHRHAEKLKPDAHKFMTDDGYEMQKMDGGSQVGDSRHQDDSISVRRISSVERISIAKNQTQGTAVRPYAFHDLELARQNALLTRLLLERESRQVAGTMIDSASYLETQSLPGQVAIATQTDRATATQTERQIRSRSDNDESDEGDRSRKKKSKKRYNESESKRIRTLWMKSPIEEEESPCFDKRLHTLRKKVKEVKEGRKIPLQPEILREISDSLDDNGSSCLEKDVDEKSTKTYQKTAEESNVKYKVLKEGKNDSFSSTETSKEQYDETSEKTCGKVQMSSPKLSTDNGKYICSTLEKKSLRKESKLKKQKTVESFIKPSFRVLEREITMLTKKLSKLADKKVQHATQDESMNHDKSRPSKDLKKDTEQSTEKTEDSQELKWPELHPSTSKETAVTKTRQKFKYHSPQVMSTGSSEYDDAFEKRKKSKLGFRQEVTKHKLTGSHAKIKKQTQTQLERKERKKQIAEQDRDRGIREEIPVTEKSKSQLKAEKTAKLSSRNQRLAGIGRREKVMEESSTSTSSNRIDYKKDLSTGQESDKKSTESSGTPTNQSIKQKSKEKLNCTSEKFSDDFVTELQKEGMQRRDIDSTIDATISKQDSPDRIKDSEVMRQFSDDFTIETRIMDIEDGMEIKQSTSHKFDKLVTSTRITEDIASLQSLEYSQPEDESVLNTKKEQAESLKVSKLEPFDEHVINFSDPFVMKVLEEHQTESPYCNRNNLKEETIYETEKHEEEIEKSLQKTEILEKKKVVAEDRMEIDIAKQYPENLMKSSDAIFLVEMKEENIKEHKTGELDEVGSDEREKLSLEKHSEEEKVLTKSALVQEMIEDKSKDKSLCEIQDEVIQEFKDLSSEYIDDESQLEKAQKEPIKVFDETCDIDRSSKHDIKNLTSESDKATITYDENIQDTTKDNLIQLEFTKEYVKKPHDDLKQLQKLDDNIIAGIEIVNHETTEKLHISPEEIFKEDEKETKSDEPEERMSTIKEVIKRTPLSIEHTKMKEELFYEEYKNGMEELFEIKAKPDEKIEEIFDERSFIDQIPKDTNLDEPAANKSDNLDFSETVVDSASTSVISEPMEAEPQIDVSVPIFTSVIDTPEVSEESDSSSDISRKTTLTTRPYETPRHRQKSMQQENLESVGIHESENMADIIIIESMKNEKINDINIRTMSEKVSSDNGEILSEPNLNGTHKQDQDFTSKSVEIVKSTTDMGAGIQNLLPINKNIILPATAINKLNGPSESSIKDNKVSTTQEISDGASIRYEKLEKIAKNIKPIQEQTVLSLNQIERIGTKEKITSAKDIEIAKTKIKNSEYETPSISEKHATGVESFESSVKKKKKFEGLKKDSSSPGGKKSLVDKHFEEKASIHSHRRICKDTESGMQARDIESQKPKRKEEKHCGKQTLLAARFKKDKRLHDKSTMFSKTSETDTSKTQSKYMAWYNKKREEAEKKRMQKKAFEDEEQLPRWVTRTLKSRTAKQKERQSRKYRTPEMTPYTRRKVKPLVNVESEQLKAIVRQGRELRKAEGSVMEDPPVQIFARTPPVTSETRHRLMQHSEYKYEKIPPPFYLHPPPAPHPSPQLSPERFEAQPSTSQCRYSEEELQPDSVVSLQGGSRLRHQQLLEKKSVFDIAYSEAAPSQLRADSTTPPS